MAVSSVAGLNVVGPPLHAVFGSACPVIVKPFNCSVTCEAAMAMQGALLTVEMVSVVEMIPLISVACVRAPQTMSPNTKKTEIVRCLERNWLIGAPDAEIRPLTK